MLGISTAWWQDSSLSGDEIVQDILNLDFQGMELEYRVTQSRYQEMKARLKKDIAVLSVHNYFPKPDDPSVREGGGDLFLLSSTDHDERSRALKYTIKTLEHANDLEVPVVVIHLGRVAMPSPKAIIIKLFQEGKMDQSEGLNFMKEQKEIRHSKKQNNVDAVLKSLDILNREAERQGVFLGIENRSHFHEIPNFEEIGLILRVFDGGRIRYWHDVGHANVQENIGICKQKALLEAYAHCMAGIHVHDVKGIEDHLAPGQGDMDFNQFKPYVKPETIQILELHPKVNRAAIEKGRRIIEESLG
jgi:sugar phosphate isomerase/epimerase